jgi:hypothetical protein
LLPDFYFLPVTIGRIPARPADACVMPYPDYRDFQYWYEPIKIPDRDHAMHFITRVLMCLGPTCLVPYWTDKSDLFIRFYLGEEIFPEFSFYKMYNKATKKAQDESRSYAPTQPLVRSAQVDEAL